MERFFYTGRLFMFFFTSNSNVCVRCEAKEQHEGNQPFFVKLKYFIKKCNFVKSGNNIQIHPDCMEDITAGLLNGGINNYK